MPTLAALRAELRDELVAAGIPAALDPSQPFTAPGALVLAGDPYLTAGPGAQGLTARYAVFLFVDPSPRFADDTEALISKALPPLLEAGYRVDEISGIDTWNVPGTSRVFVGVQMNIYDDTIDRREIN